MTKLTLIHTKDQFKLMLDETEVKSVSGYSIVSRAENGHLLDLKLDLMVEVEKIEVDNAK